MKRMQEQFQQITQQKTDAEQAAQKTNEAMKQVKAEMKKMLELQAPKTDAKPDKTSAELAKAAQKVQALEKRSKIRKKPAPS